MGITSEDAGKFLEAIGDIRGDIRAMRSELHSFKEVQATQWQRHDAEVKKRVDDFEKLQTEFSEQRGAVRTLKFVTSVAGPLIWLMVIGSLGYLAREVLALHDASLSLTQWRDNYSKLNVTPDDMQKLRGFIDMFPTMQSNQEALQQQLDELVKNTKKIADKPLPKIPTPKAQPPMIIQQEVYPDADPPVSRYKGSRR